jgi:hypothetical protein
LPADSALIANNTIVNCAGVAGLKIGNYDAGMALNQALGTRIANNVIKMNSGQAVFIEPTNTSLTYFAEGNIYNSPSGLGITSTTGFTNNSFSFGTRLNGILTPPTILQDASINSSYYNSIFGNLDAQGQTRSSTFDVGCDEMNGAGNVLYNPLDSNMVGAGKPLIIIQNQTISFNPIPSILVNSPDFNPGATASSGLAVSYTSSNTSVATIVNGNIDIFGYGSSVITASQIGNLYFNPAANVSQTLTVNRISQTINFPAIPTKVVNNADFAPGASASSGLVVTYLSSNTAVATIVNNNIHLVGYGTAVITASQSGNTTYDPALNVSQTLTVTGLSQTISFAAIPTKLTTDVDFSPGATTNSGLAITYSSSNSLVATIVNNNIHIVGAGTATITASQPGNSSYYAATNFSQTLTVNKIFTYSPSAVTILSGSLNSGTFGNLSTNNSSYYIVNSTTTGTRKIDWYGSVTITQAPSTVSKLTLTYDGKNSVSKTQILYLYNWITSAWVQIDSRTVTTTDITVTNTQTAPANFISSTGQIRMRVYSSAGTSNYACYGDWMQFQIQSTSAAKGGVEITNSLTENTKLELFPNPSNQIANLHYFLTEDSKVSVSLFDVNGKKIKSILNNELQLSGDKMIQIDNSGLSKGIYFIKVVVNNKISNLKMLIH